MRYFNALDSFIAQTKRGIKQVGMEGVCSHICLTARTDTLAFALLTLLCGVKPVSVSVACALIAANILDFETLEADHSTPWHGGS